LIFIHFGGRQDHAALPYGRGSAAIGKHAAFTLPARKKPASTKVIVFPADMVKGGVDWP
jgi:hypothetical protein